MKTFSKIILFFVLFSIGFFLLRICGPLFGYNVSTLVADLGGLTYLYSAVGIIFAIFTAFAIMSQIERWNGLTSAVKKEAGALKELYFWSQHISDFNLKKRFSIHIKQYLSVVIERAFAKSSVGEKYYEINIIIDSLHDDLYDTKNVAPQLMPIGFDAFSDLLKAHDERLHYASTNLPKILKNTLDFNDALLVVLSLMLGVHNGWLDYFFVASIAILCFVIHLVVKDLDSPMESGNWHLTAKDYQEVFDYIK